VIGIFYDGAAAEYTGRYTMVADVRMYVYRGVQAPIDGAQVFSERPPENIYVPYVHKINTFRDSGL